jgi:tRNA threonylcarbamoyladenosine biosynthesis protein TsaE
MNTAQTWRTESTSLEDTLKLAGQVGRNMRGGEVIELVSDLGGGKTAFVRGLAKGLGSPDVVHSPSFTLGNQYKGDKLTLHHFDFYRLAEPGIMRDELAEVIAGLGAVVAVEWGGIVEDVLPAERLTVQIKATGEDSREFIFSYPENLHYLIPSNT